MRPPVILGGTPNLVILAPKVQAKPNIVDDVAQAFKDYVADMERQGLVPLTGPEWHDTLAPKHRLCSLC
jgi:hypothetical protein